MGEKKEQNIGGMKKDISAGDKIEGEDNEKKEENIGLIQKDVEEAAEKTKEAANDALVAKLLAEKHLKPLKKTREVVEIITSARENNQKANDSAIDAEKLATKVKEESRNIEAAKA